MERSAVARAAADAGRIELPATPIEGVYAARDIHDDRALRRACARGEIIRLRRGAYVLASIWKSAKPPQRMLLRIAAVEASRDCCDVLSHTSAAVLHGVSLLTTDERVHLLDPSARTTRTVSGLVIHRGPQDPGIDALDLFRVTGLARTVADCILTLPFRDGVAALDSALHGQEGHEESAILREAVRGEVRRSERVHGRRTASRVLDFADPAAANPGESLSRVVIAELGFAAPALQEPFARRSASGQTSFVDFWWEGAGIVGEFDGFQKYSDPEFLRGRTPADALRLEREREARILLDRRVRRVVRWTWDDVVEPVRLARLLGAAGVPR